METIKTAKALCKAYMDAGIPVFTEGPPGVGKSELWEQVAKERGIGFIDIRLAQMDPVDLRGLPRVVGDLTTWTRPDFWPDEKRDGKEGIILFDELADCGRAMQSASYQIILNKKAGPHVIPKGWYPAAAGNRRQDRAAAQSISSALASRFAWIEIGADPECLLDYAATQGWHHYVRCFLKFKPSAVHSMEGADLRAFPCPRQWERVSRICDAPPEQLARLIGGLVGEGTAGEFVAFLRALDLPSLEDVVANPKNCHIPKQQSARYALSSMLSRFADRKNFAMIMEYIRRSEFGRDFEICTVLEIVKREASLMQTSVFVEFANRNKDLRLT